MIFGLAMVFFLFIGLGEVNAQRRNITYSTIEQVTTGDLSLTVQFNVMPNALEERIMATLNQNEQMFLNYNLQADDRVVYMQLAFEDMNLDNLREWLDNHVKVWNRELHEDILAE